MPLQNEGLDRELGIDVNPERKPMT